MLGHMMHQVRDEQRIGRAKAQPEEHGRHDEHRWAVGKGQHPHAENDHHQAGDDDPRMARAIRVAADERPGRDNREAEHREIEGSRRTNCFGVDRDEAGNAAVTERVEKQCDGANQDSPFDEIRWMERT